MYGLCLSGLCLRASESSADETTALRRCGVPAARGPSARFSLATYRLPSRHVELTWHWERRDEGLIDAATIPLESEDGTLEDFYPKAVSQAQAFWARGELAKTKRGEQTKLGILELEALANTQLAGLPERAGQNAPTKKLQAKWATKAKATPRAKDA